MASNSSKHSRFASIAGQQFLLTHSVPMGKRQESGKRSGTAEKRRKTAYPSVDVDAKSMNQTQPVAASSQSDVKDSASSAGGARPLRRRSTDEAVERCIQNKLQGVSKQAIETQPLPCGRLLRQKLGEDIKTTRGQPGTRLGATYWRGIRSYFGQSDELEKLKPDASLPVSKAMITALEAMTVLNAGLRSAESMLAWLRSCESVNERELLGIFKLCASPKKTTHWQAMQVVVATLRTIAGKSELDKYHHIYAAGKDLIDQALTSCYNSARKNGVSREAWLEVLLASWWHPYICFFCYGLVSHKMNCSETGYGTCNGSITGCVGRSGR